MPDSEVYYSACQIDLQRPIIINKERLNEFIQIALCTRMQIILSMIL